MSLYLKTMAAALALSILTACASGGGVREFREVASVVSCGEVTMSRWEHERFVKWEYEGQSDYTVLKRLQIEAPTRLVGDRYEVYLSRKFVTKRDIPLSDSYAMGFDHAYIDLAGGEARPVGTDDPRLRPVTTAQSVVGVPVFGTYDVQEGARYTIEVSRADLKGLGRGGRLVIVSKENVDDVVPLSPSDYARFLEYTETPVRSFGTAPRVYAWEAETLLPKDLQGKIRGVTAKTECQVEVYDE